MGVKLTKDNIDLQAKCWRFINHKHYMECGPYNTYGEWNGYSVGLQKPGMSCNAAIMGSGDTLEEAVVEAISKWKENRKKLKTI